MFFLRISRWFAKRPRQSLEMAVRRHWAAQPACQKTVFYLRDFEEAMWRRKLRLGNTPFDHHLDMMRLLREDLEPRLQHPPGVQAAMPIVDAASQR